MGKCLQSTGRRGNIWELLVCALNSFFSKEYDKAIKEEYIDDLGSGKNETHIWLRVQRSKIGRKKSRANQCG